MAIGIVELSEGSLRAAVFLNTHGHHVCGVGHRPSDPAAPNVEDLDLVASVLGEAA